MVPSTDGVESVVGFCAAGRGRTQLLRKVCSEVARVGFPVWAAIAESRRGQPASLPRSVTAQLYPSAYIHCGHSGGVEQVTAYFETLVWQQAFFPLVNMVHNQARWCPSVIPDTGVGGQLLY